MQGVSGSGKSTYVKENLPRAVIFSADNYFLRNGEYKFDPKKLTEAHQWCMRQFTEACLFLANHPDAEPNLLVVDNTNTQLWEMAPYVQVAAAMGAEVEVIRCVVDPHLAARRNAHGVPETAVNGMHKRLEKPLPFWACSYREVKTG